MGQDPRLSVVAGLRKFFLTQIGSVEAGDPAPLYKVYFFGDNSQYRIFLIIAARASTPASSESSNTLSPTTRPSPKRTPN